MAQSQTKGTQADKTITMMYPKGVQNFHYVVAAEARPNHH
jgi:hypothetical protein